jgi:hypothetical protein
MEIPAERHMMEKEAEKYTNVRSMYRNRTNVEYTMCDDTSNHWKKRE